MATGASRNEWPQSVSFNQMVVTAPSHKWNTTKQYVGHFQSTKGLMELELIVPQLSSQLLLYSAYAKQ